MLERTDNLIPGMFPKVPLLVYQNHCSQETPKPSQEKYVINSKRLNSRTLVGTRFEASD